MWDGGAQGMKKKFSLGGIIMVILILVPIFLAFFGGLFTHESSAITALENQGFSSIRITDKQWFLVLSCEGNAAKFTARAVNPAHQDVEIFVCVGGPFQKTTVRSN